ncbi:hypothetical protein CC86DRAFT_164958 [Ophiobolus disseminans]|uniref:Uncharacterized protein n=1 Tax=Ophiobolus disseminans TaxID=1469910 RepID=A0A6A7ABJ8_9PLEO|nr:hypothetical protein CC86DRAFT_164958 [Ophiobolus disseminans]
MKPLFIHTPQDASLAVQHHMCLFPSYRHVYLTTSQSTYRQLCISVVRRERFGFHSYRHNYSHHIAVWLIVMIFLLLQFIITRRVRRKHSNLRGREKANPKQPKYRSSLKTLRCRRYADAWETDSTNEW